MGQNLHLRQRLNELCCVVSLVCTQCDFGFVVGGLLRIGNHHFGCFTLGKAICRGDQRAGNQAVAVVAQRVALEAQLAGRVAFTVQAGIDIGGGLVGVVTAALVFEVARVTVAAVFAGETLVASPPRPESRYRPR